MTSSFPRRRIGIAAAAVATCGLLATSIPAPLAQADAPSLERAIAAADATLRVQPAAAGATAFERSKVVQGDRKVLTDFVTYTMQYKGLQVVGGEMTVVADEYGTVHDVSRDNVGAMPASVTPTLSKAAAKAAAIAGVNAQEVSEPTLVVFAEGVTPTLAYQVTVSGTKPSAQGAVPTHQVVFIDAATGKDVKRFEQAHAMEDTGYHNGRVNLDQSSRSYVSNTARGFDCRAERGGVLSGPANGQVMDLATACADAQYAAEGEARMLKEWVNRDGMDGRGSFTTAYVGVNQANAYWNGRAITLGHNSNNTRQLTAIDVVAHEYGHGLMQYTGSGYSNENGIDEGNSDIFGAATEHYLNNAKDRPDYTVGESIDFRGTGPIRIMYDPSKVGDPNCYRSGNPGEEHKAAGPLNHWFYLLAEGSNPTNGNPTSPTCNNSKVTGVGIKTAVQVWHSALLRRTGQNQFSDMRAHTLAAAKEQAPGSCELYTRVKDAWDAVSVPATKDPGCSGNAPTPTVTPTSTPKPSVTPTSKPIPSPTATATKPSNPRPTWWPTNWPWPPR